MESSNEKHSHKCLFCPFSFNSRDTLIQHELKTHQRDKSFRVTCSLCGSKYKCVKTLQVHLVNMHKKKLSMTKEQLDQPTISSEADADDDSDADEINEDMSFYFKDSTLDSSVEDSAVLPEETLQQKAFSFFTEIRDACVSPQTSMDRIVKGMDNLMLHYNSFLEGQLLSYQDENMITVSQVKSVFENLKGQSLFEGFQTRHKQKYYRKCSLTTLKPIPISTKYTTKLFDKSGLREVPVVQGYASPFLQVLEVLLQCEDILHCVLNPVKSEDGKYRSMVDGYMWQSHPVLLKDPCALVIIAYGDDLNPGDGLSSKASGHALRSFTWTLGNLYPCFRSSLKCINTLSIINKIQMDKGNGPALKDFIDGINKLSTEGVVFNIKGKPTKFHGCLLFVSGDTPASANFAGMKESPSAHCPCRLCLVTADTIFDHFTEDNSLLRDAELHRKHLEELNYGNVSAMDVDECNSNDPALPKDPSVRFGVNSRSCFLDVKHFDVTKCFPLDIMHVLAEGGVLEVNVRLLLKGAVQRGQVSLKTVNDFISELDYGPLNKDKPGPIKAEHLNNNLRQTASQMFLLAHLVPFILKNKCNPAEMKNFIRLLMILNICKSLIVDDQDAVILRKLIEDFLREFKNLYGEREMTLKMHFLIHLPSQILMYGPLTEQWCMRFEGFHAILKRLYKILHNTINLPLTLMERVLERFLNEVESCPPGKFLYPGHSGRREPAIQLKSLEWRIHVQSVMPELHGDHELTPVENLGFHGFEFKVGSILPLDSNGLCLPKFGVLFKTFLFQEIPILLCHGLETVRFDEELNSYEVKRVIGKPAVTALCLKETQPISPLLMVQYERMCFIPLINSSKVPYLALEKWNLKGSSKSKAKSTKPQK